MYQTRQVIAKHLKKHGPGPKARGYMQKPAPSTRQPLIPQTNAPGPPHSSAPLTQEPLRDVAPQALVRGDPQHQDDFFDANFDDYDPDPDPDPPQPVPVNQELPLL